MASHFDLVRLASTAEENTPGFWLTLCATTWPTTPAPMMRTLLITSSSREERGSKGSFRGDSGGGGDSPRAGRASPASTPGFKAAGPARRGRDAERKPPPQAGPKKTAPPRGGAVRPAGPRPPDSPLP